MSRRWEDGAAGGSRRGGGCRLAVHAAEGGSGDPELPVESLSAADQGERSSVCPVPRGHPASPPSRHPHWLPCAAVPKGGLGIAVVGGTGALKLAGSQCGLTSFLLPACSEMALRQTGASTRILHT